MVLLIQPGSLSLQSFAIGIWQHTLCNTTFPGLNVYMKEHANYDLRNIEQKRQGWFYSQEYIIFVTINSEGTAFLLQCLTYNYKVKLRRYNLR